MKKFVGFLILTFCMLALLCVVASAVVLKAGQSIDAGSVTVSNDGVNLYITYETIDGWELVETHLAIATSLEGIPQTKKNNPIPGKFENSMEHDTAVTEYTYVITLEWAIGTELYIAAQAEVRKQIGEEEVTGDPIYQEETGWGEGDEFAEDRNWAMYFTFTVEVE